MSSGIRIDSQNSYEHIRSILLQEARSDSVVSSEVAFAMEDATELFSSDSLIKITTNTDGGAILQSH